MANQPFTVRAFDARRGRGTYRRGVRMIIIGGRCVGVIRDEILFWDEESCFSGNGLVEFGIAKMFTCSSQKEIRVVVDFVFIRSEFERRLRRSGNSGGVDDLVMILPICIPVMGSTVYLFQIKPNELLHKPRKITQACGYFKILKVQGNETKRLLWIFIN